MNVRPKGDKFNKDIPMTAHRAGRPRIDPDLEQSVRERILAFADPRLKGAVTRRLIEKIVLYGLEQRVAAWDPFHKNAARTAHYFVKPPLVLNRVLIEKLSRDFFSGHVIPYQAVIDRVRQAKRAFLGKCICRHAGIVNDLTVRFLGSERPYLLAGEEESRDILEGIVRCHLDERKTGGQGRTGPEIREVFRTLLEHRRRDSTGYSLAALWEMFYPHFEIFLEHPDYITEFRQAMAKNKKVWEISPSLLEALIEPLHTTRGQIFTSMSVIDSYYAICSCPGPEIDDGCLIYNWHYYSGNEPIIRYNTDLCFGQRTDEAGRVMTCERFEAREPRPCLGCGCEHERSTTRAP